MNALRFLTLGFLSFSSVLSGCSRTEVARAPHDGHLISCDKGMKGCVGQAEKLCGDDGYTIVSGSSRTHMLGGESSSYRAVTQVGSLEVRCGMVEIEDEKVCHELPPRADEAQAAATPAVSSGNAGMKVCVPGATQRCVGVGACDGGQICLADGQGYGPCDCGNATPGSTHRPASPGTGSAPPSAPTQPPGPPETAPQAPQAPPSVPGAMPAPTPLGQ